MKQYEELLSGKVVIVDALTVEWLIKNMKDINTLSIQQTFDNMYAIKVDKLTIEKYNKAKA